MKISKNGIIDFILITVGTIICGAATYFFMVPSNLAIASVSGVAILIGKFIPMSKAMLILILNLVLLVISWFFVGREFTIKSIYPSVGMPVVMMIFGHFTPNYHGVMNDQFLDMICYLFLCDLGIALMFVRNASSGGLDVLYKMANKYLQIDFGVATSVIGLFISAPAIFIYNPKTGVLSILGTYVTGIIIDHYVFGMTTKLKVCILSKKNDEICEYIIDELHSGVTKYEASGGFTGDKFDEINVIVNRNEYVKLMKYLRKVDPDAFATATNIHDVMYRPKRITKEHTSK
nr:YitT family protein [uncultured Mogibacterium sp.]